MEDAVTSIEHLGTPRLDGEARWSPSELRRVVIRLVDGDVVQVGTAPNHDSARVLARSVIADIESPQGAWPLVGDRLLRPESILWIDVVAAT
jgi:hypothetical protein